MAAVQKIRPDCRGIIVAFSRVANPCQKPIQNGVLPNMKRLEASDFSAFRLDATRTGKMLGIHPYQDLLSREPLPQTSGTNIAKRQKTITTDNNAHNGDR